jgi:hypothetical protein
MEKNNAFWTPNQRNKYISSIVKGHLDTKKYSFLINIPSLIWRNLCLFGDPILKNKFIPSIVKGHLDTKKFAF